MSHDIYIKIKRLLLRPLKITDASEVFEWVSDERVSKYMVYNTYTDVEQRESTYHFGFERILDGKLIGSGDIGPDIKRGSFRKRDEKVRTTFRRIWRISEIGWKSMYAFNGV